MHHASRSSGAALFAIVVAFAVLAPAALADTVTGSNNSPVYNDTNGNDDSLTITQDPSTGNVTFHDNDAITTTAGGCSAAGNDVVCTPSVDFITLNLNAGNDSVSLAGFDPGTSFQELGGNGNDTLNAPDGTLDGGAGNDTLTDTSPANSFGFVSMTGGADADTFVAGGAFDTVSYSDKSADVNVSLDDQANDGTAGEGDNVGSGIDNVNGGPGNDTLTGNDSTNSLSGANGNDTVNGNGGDDFVEGDDGNDTLNGGAGDDTLEGDAGSDVYNGGDGNDSAEMTSLFNSGLGRDEDLTASLDGQANDGQAGENDSISSDVENIDAQTTGNATLTGNADFNVLSGGGGKNTINGGAGSDILSGGPSDDTFNAVDGFTDRVNCSGGNDTANVDQFDSVSGCKTVNRTQVANALQDQAPTVAWTAPSANSKLSGNTGAKLTATASDDRGVKQVVFMSEDRVLCTDTTAPYECQFSPTAADIQRDVLSAVAVDTNNQAAFAQRPVTVSPFVGKLSAKTTPARDKKSPFHFKTSGKLTLPKSAGSSACTGTVTVTFKAGKKTVSTRRAKLTKTCSYSSTVTFRVSRRLHPKTLKVQARYGGNAAADAVRSKSATVKTR